MRQPDSPMAPTRRALLQSGIAAGVLLAHPAAAYAAAAPSFDKWRDGFRARALAKGVSEATWNRVMGRIAPDMSVFKEMAHQPEFDEQIWQYINRRSRTGASSPARKRCGNTKRCFPGSNMISASSGERCWRCGASSPPMAIRRCSRTTCGRYSRRWRRWPGTRRAARAYWQSELINALKIVDRGWSTPSEMRGSWAGAMGHTQWMPEVWLNVGMDYDGDGKVSPFGKPDDALGSSARFLVDRGKYHAGEHWGYEVRANGASSRHGQTYAAWTNAGVTRADGQPFPQPNASAQLWIPVPGGPAFLLGPNFYAVRSYNPSMNYALAICHLGDRILGAPPFMQPFPGSERALTLAEIQEMQTRLTKAGFDTGGTDGRVGNDTMAAVRDYQQKIGIEPADGYGGLQVLARLRQGN